MNANAQGYPLEGDSVVLRPLLPDDVEYLYAEEISSRLAFRWRLGGLHPNPSAYGESLWSGVLASFIGVDPQHTERRCGIFTAYSADLRNEHAYLAAALLSEAGDNDFARARMAIEGVSRLIEYCFTGWTFRKLYFEVAEFNLPQFQSIIGRVAREEARLTSHIFYDWNWWDLVTLAIWRDDWEDSVYRLRLNPPH